MKYILTIILALFIGACVQAQDSTGNFTVKLPANVWEFIMNSLTKSEAPAKDVTTVNDMIWKQLQLQLKKPADTTNKKPAPKEGKKD